MPLTFADFPAKSSSLETENSAAQRLRSSRRRALSTEPNSRPPPVQAFSTYTLALLVLLTFGAVSSFGAAYYLFTHRWEAAALPRIVKHRTDTNLQVPAFNLHPESRDFCGDACEKFLAYLPHSGFHNQRIAFENALTLARLLNRTLLVPPIRLGNSPLQYAKFNTLTRLLSLSDKEGLRHCLDFPIHAALPAECQDYYNYTYIPWDWLVDLTPVKFHQRLFDRWNMSDIWVAETLSISKADTLKLRDLEPYHYRFLDSINDTSPSQHKYLESIYIPLLSHSPFRLIQVGTLFGSSRLRLKRPESISIRTEIRRSMTFSNPLLVEPANAIAQALGGIYLGAHIRIGDGKFYHRSHHNARVIWWKLIHVFLNFTVEDALMLEQGTDLYHADGPHPKPPSIPASFTIQHNHHTFPSFELPIKLNCRGKIYRTSHLSALNIPLFISTDAVDPLNHPSISAFLQTFPCTFFLGDFSSHLTTLNRLRNKYDGVTLKPFLESFIDAMVVGKAWAAVGTEGSTFSRFVEDMLWRTYHGFDILERG
jgi:hypothetical protein